MKQRFLALFSALLILFALVPPTFASAYTNNVSLLSSDFSPGGSDFDYIGYMKMLDNNNIPFFAYQQIFSAEGQHFTDTYIFVGNKDDSTFSIVDGILTYGDISPYNITIRNTESTGQRILMEGSYPPGLTSSQTTKHDYQQDFSVLYFYSTNTTYSVSNSLNNDNVILPIQDLPVNTFQLIEPNKDTYLVGKFSGVLQNVKFSLNGKVAVPDFGGDYEKALKFSNQFKQEFCDTLCYTYLGVEGKSAMPLITLYGKPYDWLKNGFITFECHSTFQINTWDIPETNKIGSFKVGANFMTTLKTFIFSSASYTWVSDSNQVSLSYPTDINGDNIDDNTGIVIPNGTIIDGDSGTDGNNTSSSSVTGFLSSVIKELSNIPSLANGVGNAFSNILNVFPSPIPQLALGCLIVMIFMTFLHFVKG